MAPDPLTDPANLIDASDNYLVWVNPVTGTYVTRGYNQQSLPLSPVYSRPPTWAEMSASNGAYTRVDRVWLIPKAIYPGGFPIPKPGDQIIDQEGVTWTVLERALKALRSTYWFMTRDLVLAHQLYDLIDIQRPGITYDEAGAIVRTWPDDPNTPAGAVLYKQLAAKVQLITQESVFALGISGLKGNYVCYVAKDVDIVKGDRLAWYKPSGVVYLDILGQHDPQRIDALPVLDCQQLP